MSRLLLIDDEPDILLTLHLVFEIAGYDVVDAANGREALEKVQDLPDAVILDIRLPDIDGLEVLAIMKADPRLAQIPVVCVSAHSSEHTVRRALELGAAAYLGKPFDFEQLRTAVDTAIKAGSAGCTS